MLLERWRDTSEEASLIKLMQWEIPGIEEEQQRINLLQDSIKQLSQKYREQRLEVLLLKSENEDLSAEEKMELSGLYTTGVRAQTARSDPEQDNGEDNSD